MAATENPNNVTCGITTANQERCDALISCVDGSYNEIKDRLSPFLKQSGFRPKKGERLLLACCSVSTFSFVCTRKVFVAFRLKLKTRPIRRPVDPYLCPQGH